jgi:hypothetical protein
MDSIVEHGVAVTPIDVQVRMRYKDCGINPTTPYQYTVENMYGTCARYDASSDLYDATLVCNGYKSLYGKDVDEFARFYRVAHAVSYVRKTPRTNTTSIPGPIVEDIHTYDGEERVVYRLTIDEEGIWYWCPTTVRVSNFVGYGHHVITNRAGKNKFVIDPTIEQFDMNAYDYELIMVKEEWLAEPEKTTIYRLYQYLNWLIDMFPEVRTKTVVRRLETENMELKKEVRELKQRIQVLESEKRTVRF